MLGYTFGAPELIIILVIVLLLFGAKKLPEMARSLGRSSKEFKKGMTDAAAENEPDEASPPEPAEDSKPKPKPES